MLGMIPRARAAKVSNFIKIQDNAMLYEWLLRYLGIDSSPLLLITNLQSVHDVSITMLDYVVVTCHQCLCMYFAR
jgi:hypothetical protein